MKKDIRSETDQFKGKKRRLTDDINVSETAADESTLKVECTGKLTLTAKSSNLRKGVKDKRAQIAEIETPLSENVNELKSKWRGTATNSEGWALF